MNGNLFVYVGWFPVAHAASLHGFLSEQTSLKNVLKKKERKRARKSDTGMDWDLTSRSCQFLIQKFHALQHADLHSPIKCWMSEAHRQIVPLDNLILYLNILYLSGCDVQRKWEGCSFLEQTAPTKNSLVLLFPLTRRNK